MRLRALPEQAGHPRCDQHHQLPGRPLVPQGLPQDQGALAVHVVGGQRDKGLVRHCGEGQKRQLRS